MSEPNELPPLDQLADDQDQLDWDRDKHGRMREYATDDDTVPTVPFEPGEDPR